MALSPDMVYALGQPDEDEIIRITALIDELLVQAVRAGRDKFSGCITVDSSRFGEDCLVRDAVIAAYRRAGWSVSEHSEQRDGAWVECRRVATPSEDFRDACGSYQER